MSEKDESFKVRVKIGVLRIRKGPGTTYDYYKKYGDSLFTGVGVFTIIKIAEGPGAKMWGWLKSYYEDGKEGWIALDDEYVDIL